MSDIAAGFWPCKVLDGFYGDDSRNIPVVRINVEITKGEHKGKMYTYEEAVNNKQAPYIARTCKAVGWKCQTLATIESDVAEWVKATGGESTIEIKHIEMRRGKRFDEWDRGGRVGPAPIWVKPNSIGRGPAPLKASSQENLTDSDAALRAALAEDAGGQSGQMYSGAPPSDDIPPPGDEDAIPFISCSSAYDRTVAQIAKVLR